MIDASARVMVADKVARRYLAGMRVAADPYRSMSPGDLQAAKWLVSRAEKNPKVLTDTLGLEEKPGDEKPDIQSIIDLVRKESWFEVDNKSSRSVSFITRENGNVGSESPGRKDIQEVNRLSGILKKKYGGSVRIEIDVVDERSI